MMGSNVDARNNVWHASILQVNDTIPFGHFEDEREARDSSQFTRRNEAKEKGSRSAMEYVMDKRYKSIGESFGNKWYDHLFFDIGAGFEQVVPPMQNYKFNALTMAHIGVGKQFNRISSARLTFYGGWGYQQNSNEIFHTIGAKADYLLNLSSYFYGYNPSRLANISAVVGLGYRTSQLGKGRKGSAYDAHIGLQTKFYTGPQGYIAIEPYASLGSDGIDLSESRNWRKADITYGASLSYIYYINNNLSQESKLRKLKALGDNISLANDSTPSTWHNPWFIEFSNGIDFCKTPNVSLIDSKGLETSLSVGKWFSPVVGLRLTGSFRQTTWLKETINGNETTFSPSCIRNNHNIYAGARLEAMFNPLGFMRSFDWNNRFGMYVVGGGEMGWTLKNGKDKLSCHAESYTAGLNLWARLSDGLAVFVEPRYAYTEYKIPYSNIKANKMFADDYMTVNVGLRIQNHTALTHKADNNSTETEGGRFSVGAGGGLNFIATRTNYNDKDKLNYNGRAFVGYRFDRVSNVEVAFEYISIANSNKGNFWDLNLSYPDDGYLKTQRNGLLDYKASYGMASINYMANLSELFCRNHSTQRLFDMSIFGGPTYAIAIDKSMSLNKAERLQEGHSITPIDGANNKSFLTFNLGVKLNANISKHISLWLTPTFYWMGNNDIEGFDLLRTKFMETVNIGVEYKF